MPTNTESLNRELFRLLSKYKPKPLDAEGKATPIPDEADIFKFEFTKDRKDYGTVYVTLDEDRVLTVYFGDDVTDSPDGKTPGLDYDDTWSGLLHQLSAWRMTKGLKGFNTQNKDRVGDDMARRNHMRNKDKLAEGYYATGKKSSYSDAVPTVKIVIEHSRVIEEGEQRYRNINRIFLENQLGERYLLDTKKPGIARVYARHIAEGGKVNDDRWSHIGSLCEEYTKMAGFVRATRNGQFNESAQSLVNEGIAHYQSLRESLSRMTGKRGYNAYFESWTPSLMEDGTEENTLNELFVQETLDPRIESVMPILNRIHKKVSESVVDKEMNKLAEWADGLTEAEGESLTSNNPIGIPEDEVEEDLAKLTPQQKAHEYNLDAAQREMDSRHAQGEDMTGATIDKKTYEIIKPKQQGVAEGWPGELAGGTVGGIAGNLVGTAIGGPIGGIVGGAVGGAGGGIIGRELTKEEQLNEFAPLLATGARLVIAMAPKIAQVIKNAGMATAKAAGPVAKSGAEIAAKNAGQIGVGLGAYEIGTSVAEIAKEITSKVGTALSEKTVLDLANVAFKFAIPAGIVLAILYGGKKAIDSLFSDSKPSPGVAEDLDADQKRVGQLGPTSKVKNNNIGKLVGANENFINQADQAVVSEEDEMAEGKASEKIREKVKKELLQKYGKGKVRFSKTDKDNRFATHEDDLFGDMHSHQYDRKTGIIQPSHSRSTYYDDGLDEMTEGIVKEGQDELARILQIMNHRR